VRCDISALQRALPWLAALTMNLWSHHRVSVAFAAAAVGALLALASDEAFAPASPVPPLQACMPEHGYNGPRDPAEAVLARHLSRRYLVAGEATERMVAAAFRAAPQAGLDPLLVLAVIAVESRFNPIAESVMGAKGLMQIIPKYHRARLDEFGGEAVLLDPEANILLGVQILQDYVRRAGTLEAGLQFYNGAFGDGSAQYAAKVMAERARLLWVLQNRSTTVASLNGT
jgi:soluble lytic murein transglycosylase-like protein